MAGTYQGPPPTKLVLLSALHEIQYGSKVRFLGCVTNYNTRLGLLTLHHNYPTSSTTTKAFVDIRLLLESLSATDTAIGEWVNIIGYIMKDHSEKQSEKGVVFVQALVLWSAKSIKMKEYEDSLDLRQATYKDEIR